MRPRNVGNFQFSLKSRPAVTTPLTGFWNFCRCFYTLNCPPLVFHIHVIRITGYGVIVDKPRVGRMSVLAPRTIDKRITRFLTSATTSITTRSLEYIVQRAPAVGTKMWCWSCFFRLPRSESRALCVRWVHSSNEHCVAFCRQAM